VLLIANVRCGWVFGKGGDINNVRFLLESKDGSSFSWSNRRTLMKRLTKLIFPICLLALSAQSGITFAEDVVIAEGMAITAAQFDAVKAVQKKYETSLLKTPGVVGVGIGLADGSNELALHVFFNQNAVGASAAAITASADGVPVKIIESDEIKAFVGEANRLQYNLPVPMGVSTSNSNGCYAGTLGVRAHRAGQTSKVGYITNTHVASPGGPNLCPGQAAFGVDQFQRGSLDTVPQCSNTGRKKIGDLVQHVPLVFGGFFENTVDAAFVTTTRTSVKRSILSIGNPSNLILPAALNMQVQKSGRTTGLQFGTVSTVNVTANVNYGTNCGIAKFVNQIAITPGTFSAAGDSGSLILHRTLKDAAGRFRPVGLLFAGNSTTTFANQIGDVLGALSATIDITAPN
jgi:hypothetical protein